MWGPASRTGGPSYSDYIHNNPNLNYRWDLISALISPDEILNAQFPIDYHGASYNYDPSIVEFVAKYPNEDWDFQVLSRYASMSDVLKYSHLPWHAPSLAINGNISYDVVKLYEVKNWTYASPNMIPYFDINKLNSHIRDISLNPGITPIYILKHRKVNWDYKLISRTMEPNLLLNSGIQYITTSLGYNPKISISILRSKKKEKWYWEGPSTHINVQDIALNMDLPWTKNGLSHNRGITLSYIEQFDEVKGEWDSIRLSQLLPFDDVIQHIADGNKLQLTNRLLH